MKENILIVAKELKKREYLGNSNVNLTVNFEKVIDDFRNPTKLKNLSIEELDRVLTSIDEIKGYNLTVKIDRGVNSNGDYEDDWKSVSYTFWSGDRNDERPLDTSNYGKFEWNTLGERESFNGNGLRNKLCRIVKDEENKYGKRIDGNYFEYENVGKVIDNLIELDILLDEQHEEKLKIYNKLKLEI